MEKFTIVLTHYNQKSFIKEALQSILIQDYPNIELIITDDCSIDFDKDDIIKYIEKHKKSNIINYEFIINTKNIGTTKTLNKAITKATGSYIQFFAADDALYDKYVISNFVKAFKKNSEYIITSQCFMCGTTLNILENKFVKLSLANKLNSENSKEQFVSLALDCVYGSGGTAYKKELFDKIGLFDETYKLVEDWSFYLLVTLKGYKIRFVNFNSLLHRTGGVSHNTSSKLPKHVIEYYKDILNIYDNLVFPYFSEMNHKMKSNIIIKYENLLRQYNLQTNGLFMGKEKNIKKVKKNYPAMIFFEIKSKIYSHLHTKLFHNLIYVLFISILLLTFYFLIFDLDFYYLLLFIGTYLVSIPITWILKKIGRKMVYNGF